MEIEKDTIRAVCVFFLVMLIGAAVSVWLITSDKKRSRLEYAKLYEKQDKALILRYWSGAELSTDEMEELLEAAERQKEWIEDQKAARRLLSKP